MEFVNLNNLFEENNLVTKLTIIYFNHLYYPTIVQKVIKLYRFYMNVGDFLK